MSGEFHKPTKFGGEVFDLFPGGEDDPATVLRVARDTAHLLIDRARASEDPEILKRLIEYTDTHGIDAIAELWARSSARSLPGALWRIYLVRLLIRQDPVGVALLFQRGSETLNTIDTVVAGAPMPTGPEEITALADEILRGVFIGDFAIALDRAAAFCRICASGATSVADDSDVVSPERASELTSRAARFATTAEEFTACARLERANELE